MTTASEKTTCTARAAELAGYCRQRTETYELFARIIDREVNDDARAMVLAACEGLPEDAGEEGPEVDVTRGLRGMAAALTRFDADFANDLACDYARTFLAAGIYEGTAAVPYESVYTSETHLLMQEARDEVRAIFRAARVMPNTEGDGDIPEDYAPLELTYMGMLNARLADALERGSSPDEVAGIAREQQTFFAGHVANWMGAMLDDVDKVASSDFYRAFSRALRGFIACEREDVPALAAEAAATAAAGDEAAA